VPAVRLPSVPGPSDVLAAVSGVREGIADALALVPRIGVLVGRLEALVSRVEVAVDRAESVLERADAAIEQVARTNDKADAAIGAVELTSARAGETVTTATGLAGRMGALVEDYEPALLALGPSLRRLAATFDPTEVEALVTLIDRLPRLVTHLDEDVLPVLESMGNVGPDVRDLVDIVQDLRQIVKGFPGSRLFRRRGAEEIALEEAAEDGAESDRAG
jgi:ABC-type transporter Mla subunit MlaD